MIKKTKNSARKKAKAPAAKTKKTIKSKAKKSIKKATKSSARTKAKSSAAKKTKASTRKKTKTPVKSKAKSPARAKVKRVVGKKPQNQVIANAENVAATQPTNLFEQPLVPQIISHGENQHFIPVHSKDAPPPVHDSKKEEKIFHNREEVAMHQENQKMKANMASRMGRKRIFRILGR